MGSLQRHIIKSKHWLLNCWSQNLYQVQLYWTINSISDLLIILRWNHAVFHHTQISLLQIQGESIRCKSSPAPVPPVTIPQSGTACRTKRSGTRPAMRALLQPPWRESSYRWAPKTTLTQQPTPSTDYCVVFSWISVQKHQSEYKDSLQCQLDLKRNHPH